MAEPAYWEAVPVGGVWDPITNNSVTSGDWIETPDIDQPGGGNTLARDDGVKTLMGLVPASKEYDFERKALGYAYAVGSPDYKLVRVNPLPFPKNWRFRCVTADTAGFNPFPVNVTPAADPPDPAVYMPFTIAPYLPAPNGPDASPAARLPGTTNYSRLKATMRFRPVNYPILEESEMTTYVGEVPTRLSEVYRNTSFFDEVTPVLDILLTGSKPFLKWADGPHVGDDIEGQVPDYIQKANLVIVWHHVPQEFIIPPGGFLPTKIMAGMGCVNALPWYGFPAGTLRLEAPRFKKSVQANIRTIPSSYTIPFVYDVILPFTYVNPTHAAVSPVYRGWNVLPYSDTGKWYSVKRKAGSPDPQPWIAFYDFDLLFTHVGAP